MSRTVRLSDLPPDEQVAVRVAIEVRRAAVVDVGDPTLVPAVPLPRP